MNGLESLSFNFCVSFIFSFLFLWVSFNLYKCIHDIINSSLFYHYHLSLSPYMNSSTYSSSGSSSDFTNDSDCQSNSENESELNNQLDVEKQYDNDHKLSDETVPDIHVNESNQMLMYKFNVNQLVDQLIELLERGYSSPVEINNGFKYDYGYQLHKNQTNFEKQSVRYDDHFDYTHQSNNDNKSVNENQPGVKNQSDKDNKCIGSYIYSLMPALDCRSAEPVAKILTNVENQSGEDNQAVNQSNNDNKRVNENQPGVKNQSDKDNKCIGSCIYSLMPALDYLSAEPVDTILTNVENQSGEDNLDIDANDRSSYGDIVDTDVASQSDKDNQNIDKSDVASDCYRQGQSDGGYVYV